jgi:hypothetical protein
MHPQQQMVLFDHNGALKMIQQSPALLAIEHTHAHAAVDYSNYNGNTVPSVQQSNEQANINMNMNGNQYGDTFHQQQHQQPIHMSPHLTASSPVLNNQTGAAAHNADIHSNIYSQGMRHDQSSDSPLLYTDMYPAAATYTVSSSHDAAAVLANQQHGHSHSQYFSPALSSNFVGTPLSGMSHTGTPLFVGGIGNGDGTRNPYNTMNYSHDLNALYNASNGTSELENPSINTVVDNGTLQNGSTNQNNMNNRSSPLLPTPVLQHHYHSMQINNNAASGGAGIGAAPSLNMLHYNHTTSPTRSSPPSISTSAVSVSVMQSPTLGQYDNALYENVDLGAFG